MPPTHLTLHTLLALSVGDAPPQELLQRIVADTQSKLQPHESSFYKALHRLVEHEFITTTRWPNQTIVYRLIGRGHAALRTEHQRYERVARLLQERLS